MSAGPRDRLESSCPFERSKLCTREGWFLRKVAGIGPTFTTFFRFATYSDFLEMLHRRAERAWGIEVACGHPISSFHPGRVAGLGLVFTLSLFYICVCQVLWWPKDPAGRRPAQVPALVTPVLRPRDRKDAQMVASMCARLCPSPHMTGEALLGLRVSLP